LLRAYYDHHEWATGRILRLSDGLTDEQLDGKREMGLGSLRATLFHILAAERFWMKRWKGEPTGAFPMDPAGISIAGLEEGFAVSAEDRRKLIELEAKTDFNRLVRYTHANGVAYEQKVGELLLHVANHAVHHRAQALNYLKGFDRKLPGGLDFLFYKMAHPSTPQKPESLAAFRHYGLEVDGDPSGQVPFEKPRIQNYFAYGDWALAELLAAAKRLAPEKLNAWFDTSHNMGFDTPRKSFLHMFDAENWWVRNWTIGTSTFDKLPESTSLEDFETKWKENAAQRNEFIAKQDSATAQRVVTVKPSGPTLDFRVAESFIQLCCHGTHHRAQILNMLRQAGAELPKIDYVVWLRLQN
jgi:uncharacterized damage-inducible protein DinB